MTKIEQLKKQRRIMLRGFTVGQMENPKLLKAVSSKLTKIDEEICQRQEQ